MATRKALALDTNATKKRGRGDDEESEYASTPTTPSAKSPSTKKRAITPAGSATTSPTLSKMTKLAISIPHTPIPHPTPRMRKTVYEEYSVGDIVGRGKFGVVKRGEKLKTKDAVAIKFITTEKGKTYDYNAIVREVLILNKLGSLHNENLVRFYDVFYDGKENWQIVMELLLGGELFDRIVQRKHYDEHGARNVMLQVVGGVQALHEHSPPIIHRDIKPENLVFQTADEDSSLKLTDFGFATLLKEQAFSLEKGVLLGTPWYIAPEVLKKQYYSPACDIWSLGVLLYIILAGYPPFYGKDNKETFKQIVNGNLVFHKPHWDCISIEVQDLISKMLVVEPEKRIAARDVMNHKWMKEDDVSMLHLNQSLQNLRMFNAKRKLKAAVFVCVIGNSFIHSMEKRRNKTAETHLPVLQKVLFDLRSALACKEDEISVEMDFDTFMKHIAEFVKNEVNARQIADNLFFLLDPSSSSFISLSAVDNMLKILSGDFHIEKMKLIFRIFDLDNSGNITLDELQTMLFNARGFQFSSIEERDTLFESVDKVFSEMDVNNDGKISQVEFLNAMSNNPLLKEKFLSSY